MSALDRLADKLRVGGAMGRALALLLGFVLVFLFLPKPTDDAVVGEASATGTVRLAAGQNLSPDAKSWLARVQLPDGRQVRMMFPPPLPRDGMQVPLRVVKYESGESRYYLDTEQWQAQSR